MLIVWFAQILAFVVGISLQDVHLSLYTLLAGTVLATMVIVPPWPYFNKHPVKWLPGSKSKEDVGLDITMDGKKIR